MVNVLHGVGSPCRWAVGRCSGGHSSTVSSSLKTHARESPSIRDVALGRTPTKPTFEFLSNAPCPGQDPGFGPATEGPMNSHTRTHTAVRTVAHTDTTRYTRMGEHPGTQKTCKRASQQPREPFHSPLACINSISYSPRCHCRPYPQGLTAALWVMVPEGYLWLAGSPSGAVPGAIVRPSHRH